VLVLGSYARADHRERRHRLHRNPDQAPRRRRAACLRRPDPDRV